MNMLFKKQGIEEMIPSYVVEPLYFTLSLSSKLPHTVVIHKCFCAVTVILLLKEYTTTINPNIWGKIHTIHKQIPKQY